MEKALRKTLWVCARFTLWRYAPFVVAVTGSVGKTSTREAIYAVLSGKHRVRRSLKNLNTEIGVPLAILGLPHYGKNIFGWGAGLCRAVFRVVVKRADYPEILVLEMGADRPGDIRALARLAPPSIAVLTAIGEIPAHVEFFSGPLAVAEEKAELAAALPSDGTLVYNADDEALLEVRGKTRAPKMTFGFEKDADVRVVNYEVRIIERDGEEIPDGVIFKLAHDHSVVPFRLHGALGRGQAYAAAAAAAVGIRLRMNLVEISRALESYVPPPGRGRILAGIKGSWIIDDTYNASPESMNAALDLLAEIPAKRKIAVLGDMLEIGKYTEEAHRALGDRVAGAADMLFTVGERAKFIADESKTRGVEKGKRMDVSRVATFDDPAEAGRALDPMIAPGDLILVKGSQALRMEKVVEEIMAEPERAGALLVRQNPEWKRKPFTAVPW